MTKPLTPLNAAVQSQLAVMEHMMHNLTSTINDAQDDIAENNRNGAVGALMECKSGFKNLKALADAIMVMHRNAAIIERSHKE